MYLGVDIGGTKTLLGVFSDEGELKEKLLFPTSQKYDDFLKDLAANVAKLTTSSFGACGVGVPGRLDRANGVAISCGNLGWKMAPIQTDLENLLKVPIIIENDAKLAGLSEALELKKDFKKVLYVTIGTGIGVSIIVNGVIDTNFGDGGGRHMMFEHKGKVVSWEDFASGRAIVNQYGQRAEEITDESAWHTIARNIAVGLLDLIAVVEPEVIVVGGGIGAHFGKYQKFLVDELKKYEAPMLPIPPIRQAKRAEEAVIYGCFELARKHHAPIN